jgi:6-pyruvoyltetrahydropterin/6-carboxytetrahydropterin synthase
MELNNLPAPMMRALQSINHPQNRAVITKTFKFESAHQLPNHRGKCANLHGHSYVMQVAVHGYIKSGSSTSDEGMVMDFGDLDAIVAPMVADYFDHKLLNIMFEVPTAENIATFWAGYIKEMLPTGIYLASVKLWETDKCFVEVEG